MFNLDEVLFGKNVRSGRKGAAGGPSGMTHDHLRPLLESPKDLHLLYTVCDLCEGSDARRSGGHQVGTDDSSPEGRRRRARHCGRRSHLKSRPPQLRSNMHSRPDQDASALHMHFKL